MRLACIQTSRGPRTVIIRGEASIVDLESHVVAVVDREDHGHATYDRTWRRMKVRDHPEDCL
jgi:hypothetical protein